jgi:HAMP domain-containing protein
MADDAPGGDPFEDGDDGGYIRIEGRVPSVEDREKIGAAAAAMGMSKWRFVGLAALERATGTSLDPARLEHVLAIQEYVEVTGRALVRGLDAVRRELALSSTVSAGQHDKIHVRLGRALDALEDARQQLDASMAAHARTQELLLGKETLVAKQAQHNGDLLEILLERLPKAGIPEAGGRYSSALASTASRLAELVKQSDGNFRPASAARSDDGADGCVGCPMATLSTTAS